jgi:LPXTG-motif cell wall-anchored protein
MAGPPPRVLRRRARPLLTLLLAAVLVAAGTGSAQAVTGYRYWNYFHVTGGEYVFAKTGPADFVPKDGSVEAYRYGLSSVASGLEPRTGPTAYPAATICRGTTPGSGEKTVGVLIDYGTADDAAAGETPPEPRAACAVVPAGANGQQVLDAVADVRVQEGVTCGIDGYPVRTCSVTVKNAPAAAPETTVDFALPRPATSTDATRSADTGSDSGAGTGDGDVPWSLVGAVAAVLLLGGGALLLARRNKNA